MLSRVRYLRVALFCALYRQLTGFSSRRLVLPVYQTVTQMASSTHLHVLRNRRSFLLLSSYHTLSLSLSLHPHFHLCPYLDTLCEPIETQRHPSYFVISLCLPSSLLLFFLNLSSPLYPGPKLQKLS